MKIDPQGKVVFITGASSGIGEYIARDFAARGAHLALVARRTDRIEALALELQAKGIRAVAIAGDVTRDGDMEAAVAKTHDTLGTIDIVVANAGFGVVGALTDLKLDDHRRQFETNVFGVLRTLYATLDDVKSRKGAIAVVGSVSGYLGAPGTISYTMSKFAVRGLCETLMLELAPDGVSVTHIAPGFVKSEIRQVNNKGVYSEKARDGVPEWLRMETAPAAREMVDAVLARKSEVVITGHGKAIVFIRRHVPWALDTGFKLAGSRTRKYAKSAT